MNKFYPLTPSVGKKLRDSNLTAAQWRLWSYLSELDPFGDLYTKLPDLLTIMQEVGIKKTTFYKAIAKFQEEKLFDFQSHGFDFRNLDGASSFVRPDKTRKVFRKRGNSVRDRGTNFEDAENQPPQSAHRANPNSSQTLTDFTDYSYSPLPPLMGERGEGSSTPPSHSPPESKNGSRMDKTNPRAMGTNPRTVGINPRTMELNEVSSSQSSISPDENPPACNTVVVSSGARMEERMRSQTSYKPALDKRASGEKQLPHGDWKDEKGFLKKGFMEYAMASWRRRFPNSQSWSEDDVWKTVVNYFRNDQNRLFVEWEAYLSNSSYRMDNAVTRISHGLALDEQEKQSLGQKFVEVANADVTDLPSSLPNKEMVERSVNSQSTAAEMGDAGSRGMGAELLPPIECRPIAASSVTVPHQSIESNAELSTVDGNSALHVTENSSAYKPWQPSTNNAPATEEDWASMRSRMSGIFKPMPKRESVPETDLDLLKADLINPVCRQDFDVQAKCRRFLASDSRYEAEYDSNGLICAIEMRF